MVPLVSALLKVPQVLGLLKDPRVPAQPKDPRVPAQLKDPLVSAQLTALGRRTGRLESTRQGTIALPGHRMRTHLAIPTHHQNTSASTFRFSLHNDSRPLDTLNKE